jgi:hypothetical protein
MFLEWKELLQVDFAATKFNLIRESPSRQRSKYKLINENFAAAKLNYASGNVHILSYLDSVSIALKLD